jgi:hypothetical protein
MKRAIAATAKCPPRYMATDQRILYAAGLISNNPPPDRSSLRTPDRKFRRIRHERSSAGLKSIVCRTYTAWHRDSRPRHPLKRSIPYPKLYTMQNDWLYGGDGDNILRSGGKGDVLDGGAGFDIASYTISHSPGVVIDLGADLFSGDGSDGDIAIFHRRTVGQQARRPVDGKRRQQRADRPDRCRSPNSRCRPGRAGRVRASETPTHG